MRPPFEEDYSIMPFRGQEKDSRLRWDQRSWNDNTSQASFTRTDDPILNWQTFSICHFPMPVLYQAVPHSNLSNDGYLLSRSQRQLNSDPPWSLDRQGKIDPSPAIFIARRGRARPIAL